MNSVFMAAPLEMITIAITCYNEEKYIERSVRSALAFNKPEGVDVEILVVDGMSTDKSRSIVSSIQAETDKVQLIDNPDRYQSHGVNLAIAHAKGEYLAWLSAHAIYPPDYLLVLYEASNRTNADCVGGVIDTRPGSDSYSGHLVQALTTHRFGIGNSGFKVGQEKEKFSDTAPSGFFRLSIFEKVGNFDERLVRCQDYEMSKRITSNGGRILVTPNVRITYFNQPSIGRLLRKQIVIQGPYNPYAWYIASHSFNFRHAITAVFTVSLFTGIILSIFFGWARIVLVSALGIYLALALISSVQQAIRYNKIANVLVLPFVFFAFHISHGLGVLKGVMKLIFGTAPVQKQS
jgi:glycosyltransferase involved in cell wall biosynthesis